MAAPLSCFIIIFFMEFVNTDLNFNAPFYILVFLRDRLRRSIWPPLSLRDNSPEGEMDLRLRR